MVGVTPGEFFLPPAIPAALYYHLPATDGKGVRMEEACADKHAVARCSAPACLWRRAHTYRAYTGAGRIGRRAWRTNTDALISVGVTVVA